MICVLRRWMIFSGFNWMLASEQSKEWIVWSFDGMAHKVGSAIREHILSKLPKKSICSRKITLGQPKANLEGVLI